MKKSDFINNMVKDLWIFNSPEQAKVVLDYIEEAGMLPPYKEYSYDDKEYIHKWEPEEGEPDGPEVLDDK